MFRDERVRGVAVPRLVSRQAPLSSFQSRQGHFGLHHSYHNHLATYFVNDVSRKLEHIYRIWHCVKRVSHHNLTCILMLHNSRLAVPLMHTSAACMSTGDVS